MFSPALKPSLKPILKACEDFGSHLPWLGQVIQQRDVGLLIAFSCQLLSMRCGISPVPFRSLQLKPPLLTNNITMVVDCLRVCPLILTVHLIKITWTISLLYVKIQQFS